MTGKVSETLFQSTVGYMRALEDVPPAARNLSDVVVEARWAAHEGLHARIMEVAESPAGWLGRLAHGSDWALNNYQMNLGGSGGGTSIHYHHATMSSLVFGRKRWLLIPPAHAYYSTRHFADDFEEERSKATTFECVQQSGDVLFLPALWGHGVLYERESWCLLPPPRALPAPDPRPIPPHRARHFRRRVVLVHRRICSRSTPMVINDLTFCSA